MFHLKSSLTKNHASKQKSHVTQLALAVALLALLGLILAACSVTTPAPAAATSTPAPAPTQPPAPTATSVPEAVSEPSVTVNDQEIVDNTVTVAEVASAGPGWIVIHIQAEGAPGPVIGQAQVADGVNENVVVEIDTASATETLYAMLHTDTGQVGTYEFPGDDVPVKVDEQVVTPAFQVSGLGMETAEPANVTIVDSAFQSKELTIPAGTTVIWTHTGNRAHTVTADDGSFDSGTLGNGDTFEFTFSEPGSYPYYCRFHGGPGGVGMAGTITVTP